jgi:hypothetical protein
MVSSSYAALTTHKNIPKREVNSLISIINKTYWPSETRALIQHLLNTWWILDMLWDPQKKLWICYI